MRIEKTSVGRQSPLPV